MSNQLTIYEADLYLKNIGLNLRSHQIEGVETILTWYERHHGGILADEMGLGKTCQAIVAVSILCTRNGPNSHVLVICPLSVLDHWEYEIKRFSCNRLKVFRYYDSKEKRARMRENQLKKENWNVLLTTFETFLNDSNLLCVFWDFAIFDEAHRIKNDMSLLHRAVESTNIGWLLLMTGTPIQNNLPEFYSLLKLVDANRFLAHGTDRFMNKYSSLTENKDEVTNEFRMLFKEYCLRRNKKILKDVPTCSEVILYHSITKLQYELYKAILSNNRAFFEEQTNSDKAARQSLMSVMTQLCKCCNHPYLFKGIEPEPFTEGEHLVAASGKTLILDRLLAYLYSKGHRVLIFSQMKRFLDIVHDIMLMRNYNFEQLDGSVKTHDRLKAIENFQRPDSNVFAFLLTTKAGGFGLNLTAADTAIFLDWDFNPQNDKQAAARCHRIGQDKTVKIIRLIAKHTVEELIKYRATKKLKLSELVLGTDEKNGPTSYVNLTNLLIAGLKNLEEAQQREQENSDFNFKTLTDVQLEDKIGETQRNKRWKIQYDKECDDVLENNNDSDEENAVKSMYIFEGKDYTEDRQALEQIIQGRKLCPSVAQGNSIDDLASRISRAVANNAIHGDDLFPERHRKIPTKLSEEEKEERRRKRIELEKQRRENAIKEKKNRLKLLWQSNNYTSTNLPLYQYKQNDLEYGKDDQKQQIHQKTGSIFNVHGDVTQPKRAPSDICTNVLIMQAVDDGGHFGVGGVFSSMQKLSTKIRDHYELAFRMNDLHRSDSHLIKDISTQPECEASVELSPDENCMENLKIARKLSVVLLVVQSVKDRYTKTINALTLNKCFERVQNYVVNNGITSVHLPQIWFGVQGIDEFKVRTFLNRHFCSRGVNVYIYRYFKRKGKLQL